MNPVLVIVIICVFVYIINKHNHRIGKIGENIVRNILNKLPCEYIVYNNIRFGALQVDHLVLHSKSKTIFVIETKMWGGKIIGKYNDKKWLQYKGGVKFLENPIKQNNRHCNAVRKKYKGYNVNNVVVFVRNKNIPKFRCVINEDKLIDYISNKVSNRGRIDIQTEWLSIMGKL